MAIMRSLKPYTKEDVFMKKRIIATVIASSMLFGVAAMTSSCSTATDTDEEVEESEEERRKKKNPKLLKLKRQKLLPMISPLLKHPCGLFHMTTLSGSMMKNT